MKRPGRPTLLTPQRQQIIVDALSRGHTMVGAAGLAGVTKMSLWRWADRGTKAAQIVEEGGECPPGEEIYLAFSYAIARARAQAEDSMLTVVAGASVGYITVEDESGGLRRVPFSGDGKVAMSWLKAARPDTWGGRVKEEQDEQWDPQRARDQARKLLGTEDAPALGWDEES